MKSITFILLAIRSMKSTLCFSWGSQGHKILADITKNDEPMIHYSGWKIVIILVAFSTFSFGQKLELYKGKKKLVIYKNSILSFKLNDGLFYKGRIDSLSQQSMVLKTESGEFKIVSPDQVVMIKQCGYLLLWGARGHFWKYCTRTNVVGYKYKFKPINDRRN